MRKVLTFLMTLALIAVPVGRMIRRSEQRKVLARLKQLGWGLGESEKLYNDYYSHWPSRS